MLASAAASAMIQVGLALMVLLGGLAWLSRRAHSPRSTTRLVRLTPTDAVHVVEVDGRRLLVGTGGAGAPRLLCELEPRETSRAGGGSE